jgi:hypothetical protein
MIGETLCLTFLIEGHTIWETAKQLWIIFPLQMTYSSIV